VARKLNPERSERFLQAALKLFVAKGVQHTSTAEIAAEAGTAAGTLFLYFATKQDLINALVLKIGQDQSDAIKALLDPSLSARETFFTIWNGSLGWLLENMDAYQYIQQVRDAGVIDEAVVQESNKFFDYYYAAIQKGLAEGCLKPYPPELIGEFLYHDIAAMMHIIKALPDEAKRAEVIRLGFDIYWDGIQKEIR